MQIPKSHVSVIVRIVGYFEPKNCKEIPTYLVFAITVMTHNDIIVKDLFST